MFQTNDRVRVKTVPPEDREAVAGRGGHVAIQQLQSIFGMTGHVGVKDKHGEVVAYKAELPPGIVPVWLENYEGRLPWLLPEEYLERV